MNILGISAYYHDSAACLFRDGQVIAAAGEERFTRKKHDHGFPDNAIRYCLAEGKIQAKDLDYVGFYDKPLVKFERILLTYIATFPKSFRSFNKAVPLWLTQKLRIPALIRKHMGYDGEVLFGDHHMSHAASSFLVSPFKEAAILTLDGVGEWSTATQGVGRDREIQLWNEIRFPHSLGLLYSAFTYFLGFKVNSAEYKVMGLAPYGEPRFVDQIMKEIIHVGEDGSFKMNMDYFAYDYGLTMTNGKFSQLFGIPVREGEGKLEQVHKDLAASVQKVTEEIVLRMCRTLNRDTGLTNLCMAGGVALNCVANGKVLRSGMFEDIWIQPAAGDAGGALGAAYAVWHIREGKERVLKRRGDAMNGAYLGPEFSDKDIRRSIDNFGAKACHYQEFEELANAVATRLAEGKVIGEKPCELKQIRSNERRPINPFETRQNLPQRLDDPIGERDDRLSRGIAKRRPQHLHDKAQQERIRQNPEHDVDDQFECGLEHRSGFLSGFVAQLLRPFRRVFHRCDYARLHAIRFQRRERTFRCTAFRRDLRAQSGRRRSGETHARE